MCVRVRVRVRMWLWVSVWVCVSWNLKHIPGIALNLDSKKWITNWFRNYISILPNYKLWAWNVYAKKWVKNHKISSLILVINKYIEIHILVFSPYWLNRLLKKLTCFSPSSAIQEWKTFHSISILMGSTSISRSICKRCRKIC